MTVQDAIREAYEYLMGFTGRVFADQLVAYAMKNHGDLFLLESNHLITKATLRQAKDFMKSVGAQDTNEDVDSQNQIDLPLGILPGMRPPRTLVVETEQPGRYCHVRYDVATWEDMVAARHEKEKNIEHAILRRDDHLRKMDALAPYLETTPGRTIAEACELLRKDFPEGL